MGGLEQRALFLSEVSVRVALFFDVGGLDIFALYSCLGLFILVVSSFFVDVVGFFFSSSGGPFIRTQVGPARSPQGTWVWEG